MLKIDLHICRVSIFMSKLQNVYPNGNIYVENVDRCIPNAVSIIRFI